MQRHYVMVSWPPVVQGRGGGPQTLLRPWQLPEPRPPPVGWTRIQGLLSIQLAPGAWLRPLRWPGCRPRQWPRCQTTGLPRGPARSPGCPWQPWRPRCESPTPGTDWGSQELTGGAAGSLPAPMVRTSQPLTPPCPSCRRRTPGGGGSSGRKLTSFEAGGREGVTPPSLLDIRDPASSRSTCWDPYPPGGSFYIKKPLPWSSPEPSPRRLWGRQSQPPYPPGPRGLGLGQSDLGRGDSGGGGTLPEEGCMENGALQLGC